MALSLKHSLPSLKVMASGTRGFSSFFEASEVHQGVV